SEQPKDVSACADASVELLVSASGAGLKYQWRRNGAVINGATTSKYSIAALNAMTAGSYDCVVTGSCNPSATSRPAIVAISSATAITKQPVGTTVEEGKPLTLTVTASGSALRYQWSKNGAPITDATSAEYKVPAVTLGDAGAYSCAITGGCGNIVSAEASVIVTPSTSVFEDAEVGSLWAQLLGPTPSDEYTVVRISMDQFLPATAIISDAQGRIISTVSLGVIGGGASDFRIPLTRCVSGLHSIQISAGSQRAYVKIMVR
ncbi:MAG: immunoglobulin domain-containing protein, partial [Candidatus Kapabacteria bacterium]|nr:immunoglobulin domain-containing protein [Candidatus Kapabacteria bacterium]